MGTCETPGVDNVWHMPLTTQAQFDSFIVSSETLYTLFHKGCCQTL